MADPYLEYLANQPITNAARANKIWLPQGRLPPKPPSDEEMMNRRANGHARRAAEERRHAERLSQLFDYYATTAVPVERVAEHCGTEVGKAREELRKRGRAA